MTRTTMLVAGRAEAAEPQMQLFSPTARSAVRYADELSWTAATAVALALGGTPDGFKWCRNKTGLITISPDGPARTIAALAEASVGGFSSPLRYPAAGPGALGGVVCIMHDLRGPTMNLTMPSVLALPTALVLAGRWIAAHQIPLVVLLVSRRIGDGNYRARCVLLAGQGLDSGTSEAFSQIHSEWLLSELGTR